jgi:hypothetical protein
VRRASFQKTVDRIVVCIIVVKEILFLCVHVSEAEQSNEKMSRAFKNRVQSDNSLNNLAQGPVSLRTLATGFHVDSIWREPVQAGVSAARDEQRQLAIAANIELEKQNERLRQSLTEERDKANHLHDLLQRERLRRWRERERVGKTAEIAKIIAKAKQAIERERSGGVVKETTRRKISKQVCL